MLLGFRLDDGVYPDSKHPKTGKPLFRDAGSFNPDEHDWLWLYSRLDKDAADGMGGGMGAGDDMIGGATGSEIEAELRAGRAIAQRCGPCCCPLLVVLPAVGWSAFSAKLHSRCRIGAPSCGIS